MNHKQPLLHSPMEPRPRPIKLEAHVLAYLGDFMNIFEESIRRIAMKEINNPLTQASPLVSSSLANTLKPPSPPPASQ